MKEKKLGLEALVGKICSVANRASGAVLMFLVVVLLADVLGRFLGYPVLGSYEIVQYGFAVVICLSVAYAGFVRAHIAVDFLFSFFPPKIQRALNLVSELLSLSVLLLIVWRLSFDAFEAYTIDERSTTLGIPVFLFAVALATGFALLALVVIVQVLKVTKKSKCRL